MALVHADPELLREFVLQMTAVRGRLREGWDALIRDWFLKVRSAWDDEAAREAEERLTAVNDRLRFCFEAFEEQGRRLTAHAGRLEAYLSDSPASSASGAGVSGTAPAALVSKPAVRRWGPTGAAVASRDGRVLELWSFVGASPSDFDWGDESFPSTFETQPHHGNTADLYRRWVGAAASVVEQVREHGWDSVRGEDARQVRDVFLGSEPPRIVLRADGSKPVVESRHRVLAAIQQGAAIPVLVVRLPGPGSAQAASSCPACQGSQRCRDCGGSGRTKTLGIAESLEGLGLETVPERICPACGGSGRCRCRPRTTPEKR